MLVLDHAFVCTTPEPPELDALRELGFTVEFSREHPGQGTRNRLLLLQDNYLELLWLADRAEAEANMVRLDRRVDWAKTGACPFGIALRGSRAGTDVPWVRYTLEAFPITVWLDGRTLDEPSLPLVFALDRPEDIPAGPRHGGYPKAFLEHSCGSTRIESVTLYGPGLGRAPALALPDNVRLREAEAFRMKLEVDGRIARTNVGPLIELCSGSSPKTPHS